MEEVTDDHQAKRIYKNYTVKEAKNKAAKYCVYQERTQQDVRNKLYSLGLLPDDVENTIVELVEDNFINEERYAIAYSRGKFNQSKWGKHKIQFGLKQKGLSDYCIKKGISSIQDDEYEQMVLDIIEKKQDQLNEENLIVSNNKIASYLFAKGFEKDLIWNFLNDRGNP